MYVLYPRVYQSELTTLTALYLSTNSMPLFTELPYFPISAVLDYY